jgi:hypothetical protein
VDVSETERQHRDAHLAYVACRLTVPVRDAAEFRTRYEAIVPELPREEVRALVERGASWSEMERLIGAAAPFGFLIYLRNPIDLVMRLAGDSTLCTAYLMGNHLIAERMYRHDPSVMMYAPLRTVIWEDRDGRAWFAVDQPSAVFGSFGKEEIAAVGIELDHKLATLLTELEVPVPDALTR